jgi:hypothetical protein
MKESTLQKIIFDYVTTIGPKYGLFIFSVPNESLMQSAMIIVSKFLNRSIGKTMNKRIPKWVKSILAILVNHFKKMGMIPGMTDMCLIGNINGMPRTIFFEVKAPGGRVSKTQEIIHKVIRGIGYPVYVVNSLESFIKALQHEGVRV